MTGKPETPLRTVAFLDILGFRSKLSSSSLLDLAATYGRRVFESKFTNRPFDPTAKVPRLFTDHPDDMSWCTQYIFSDSIILISHDKDLNSCLKLIVYAWRLTQNFIAFEMPLRGSVAFGEMYSNPEINVFLGKALTKAYDLEQSQNWIGVAIDSSVTDNFSDFFQEIDDDLYPVLNDLLFKYPVPLNNGTTITLRTLNWRWNLIVEKGTRFLFPYSNDPRINDKIQNTLEYAKAIVQTGRLYIQDQDTLPVELRSSWIGEKQPPFPHGDDL